MLASAGRVTRTYGIYLLRNWWEQRTYRTAVALGAVSTIVGLTQFAFLGWFLQQEGTYSGISMYGGNIAAFMISGTVFTGFVAVALSGFSGALQREQVMGTLEPVSQTRMGIVGLMSFEVVTSFIGTVLGSILMLNGFAWILGFELRINLAALLVALSLTLVVVGGFGLAGCGVILVTKKGDPVTWLVVTSMTLLSGVLYPVTILPGWLQTVSAMLPTTVALDLTRKSLLTSTTLLDMWPEIRVLLLWSALTVPLGIWVLSWGLRRGRQLGSLNQF